MTAEQKGILLDSLMDFGVDGVVYAGDDPLVKMAFNVMAAGITRAAERYQKRVDANRRNIKKRYDGIPSNTIVYRGGEKETVSEEEREKENGDVKEVVFVSKGPSLEEVQEYVKKQQLKIDPLKFFSYYSARDWQLRPGQPLRNWQAACRTWDLNEKDNEGAEKNVGEKHSDDLDGYVDANGVRADRSLYNLVTF